jgi:hypothetical protein
MQPLVQADAAAQHAPQADEADEADPDLGPTVLLNGLLFAQIWSHLKNGDKKQLRAVGRGVRALADALVETLDMHGKSASLASALALFPSVQRLEAESDEFSAAVISAAPLAKLKALVLSHLCHAVSHARMGRSAPCGGGGNRAMHAHGWQLLARVPCSALRAPSQSMQLE